MRRQGERKKDREIQRDREMRQSEGRENERKEKFHADDEKTERERGSGEAETDKERGGKRKIEREWFLYQMVSQNMLRTHEENRAFRRKHSDL